MTKKEFAEVLVRYTGILAAIFALTKSIKFAGSMGMMIYLLPEILLEDVAKTKTMTTLFTAVPNVISFLIFAALAYLLLKKEAKWVTFLSR